MPSTSCLFRSTIRSFDGFQRFRRNLNTGVKIGVVGAAFEKGQSRPGVAGGPSAIRRTGVLDELRGSGHDVLDYGDVSSIRPDDTANSNSTVSHKLRNWDEVAAYNQKVSQLVSRVSSEQRKVLTLGGDHSVGFGTVHGHLASNPDACVLWVDAHADILTTEINSSGYTHGMPVSFLIKELNANGELPGLSWLKHKISHKNLAFLGLRDIEPGERSILKDLGICAITMEDIDHMGIKKATQFAISQVDPKRNRPIHVSFDIDALDPVEARSTGTPVRGGLSLREGMTLLDIVRRTGRLSALDLVEVNPSIGSTEDVLRTTDAARRLIFSAFETRNSLVTWC